MMKTENKSRLVLLYTLIVLALPSWLFAEKLDIFDSRAPFPADIWFDAEKVPDLEKMPAEGIKDALAQFVRAEGKARDGKARNLLSLAIGYLQLRNKDYSAALATLRKRIKGNFALEDYRLRYESIAFRERALLEMGKNRPLKAMADLEKAINLALEIYQTYPESPFMEDTPRFLAQCEKDLGDAYFKVFNYKSAWRSYQRALMRDFAGNRDHVVEVSRSLAKTYETAGDPGAAVEIYGYLLKNFKDPVTEEAFRQFMEKRGPELKSSGMAVDSFVALLSETGKKGERVEQNGKTDRK
ncbi:MAG: hypothetical protein HZA02_04485 [Nitrospinae bacterium]|nr:hypothetical protein [Nitrospinota bacterium]